MFFPSKDLSNNLLNNLPKRSNRRSTGRFRICFALVIRAFYPDHYCYWRYLFWFRRSTPSAPSVRPDGTVSRRICVSSSRGNPLQEFLVDTLDAAYHSRESILAHHALPSLFGKHRTLCTVLEQRNKSSCKRGCICRRHQQRALPIAGYFRYAIN